jgi:hypothetical protein
MFEGFHGVDGKKLYLSALQVRAVCESPKSSEINLAREAEGKAPSVWCDVIVGPEQVTVTISGHPHGVASRLNDALSEFQRLGQGIR